LERRHDHILSPRLVGKSQTKKCSLFLTNSCRFGWVWPTRQGLDIIYRRCSRCQGAQSIEAMPALPRPHRQHIRAVRTGVKTPSADTGECHS